MVLVFSTPTKCLATNLVIVNRGLMVLLYGCSVLYFFLHPKPICAQQFELLRYQEDYSFLKDSSLKGYQNLKYLPLSAYREIYLSIGGEIRAELAGKINENWIMNQGLNTSLLQRYFIHADLKLGSKFRVFAQLNSAIETGNKYPSAKVDVDELVVQNLFLEYQIFSCPKNLVGVRFGRQEINYGSGRLISVREGNNVRQYFTGAKISFSSPKIKVDGFAFSEDRYRPGVLDNKLNLQMNLWGGYANVTNSRIGNFDLYYLGIRRDKAIFEAGQGKELRHTTAIRYWKSDARLTYNLEAAYQFGRLADQTIRAWTLALELAYPLGDSPRQARVNLRNDYISGDASKEDGRLTTFNPVYPKGGYFGFNPLIGPANLIDIHPYLTWPVSSKFTLQADIVFNWRYAKADGLYHPSGNFNIAASHSPYRYIGTTYLMSAALNYNKSWSFNSGFQFFKIGPLIKNLTKYPTSSIYFNFQTTMKF